MIKLYGRGLYSDSIAQELVWKRPKTESIEKAMKEVLDVRRNSRQVAQGKPPSWNQQGLPRCFNCQRYGHMAFECPDVQETPGLIPTDGPRYASSEGVGWRLVMECGIDIVLIDSGAAVSLVSTQLLASVQQTTEGSAHKTHNCPLALYNWPEHTCNRLSAI